MQDVATDCNVAVLFQDGIRKTIGRSNADPLSEEHRPCGSLLIPAVRPSLCCWWEPCPLLRISPVLGFRLFRAHSMTGPTSVFLSSCLPLSFYPPSHLPLLPPPPLRAVLLTPSLFHPPLALRVLPSKLLRSGARCRCHITSQPTWCLSSMLIKPSGCKQALSFPTITLQSFPALHSHIPPSTLCLSALSASSLLPYCSSLPLLSVSCPPFLPSRSLFSLLCMTVSEVCSQVCSHLISQFLLG